jgi:hypothetical protein
MALVLKIATIDRSSSVNWRSLSITSVLSKEVDQLEFHVRKTSGSKYIPSAGQEVTLEEDTVKIFGGVIVEIQEVVEAGILLSYKVRCKDYSHYLDRKLATKTYTGFESGDIITDLIATYTTGFTTANVPATTPIIETMRFNYEQLTRAITKIADTIGWDWFVDPDKDIHFFSADSSFAPFNLTDTGDLFEWKSLEINQNIQQLRNVVFVRGGEYKKPILEAQALDKYEAQNGQVTFPLAYRYDNITVKKNGVVQTVGIDNKDTLATKDALYNFTEKFITFDPMSAGDDVVIYGDAYIPVIAQARDTDSITTYGEYQTVVIDKNITSIEEALLRARIELIKYSEGTYEASFRTKQTGLRVGQRINVTLSSNRSVTRTLKINRITGKADSSGTMEYTAYLVSSGQVTLHDIFIELLERDKQNIVIAPNEVIQALEILFETFSVTDSAPIVTTDSPPYHWATGVNEGSWSKSTWS